jgi:hypothetical protein
MAYQVVLRYGQVAAAAARHPERYLIFMAKQLAEAGKLNSSLADDATTI